MQHTPPTVRSKNQAGFTIVELMVATLVFSIILLVITMGVLSFTNSYYRGVNASTTQTTTRTTMDAVTQAIQFTGYVTTPVAVPLSSTDFYFCAGTKVYMFTPGVLVASSPGNGHWGLYEGTNVTDGSCTPLTTATTDGMQLLNPNMRVGFIKLASPSLGLYTIDMRFAYGPDDLLCDQKAVSPTPTCASGAQLTALQIANAVELGCKSTSGSQFCATAELATSVQPRLPSGS